MKKILLIITGGVAAFKALEVLRQLKKNGHIVRCILTAGAQEFITPLSVAALSGEQAYTTLWDTTQEAEIGHIQLVRWADVVVVVPATANFIAKMAHGLADDLASTALLANINPVLIAPAMNVRMWEHPATYANMALLRARGVQVIAPEVGEMACGEVGEGRLAAVEGIIAAVQAALNPDHPLKGKHMIITAGGTREAIDPVRFIGNHSSGKQGYAIATAALQAGARVTLISAPTGLTPPPVANYVAVSDAASMLAAVEQALPADVFIGAAAVADWCMADPAAQKLKKNDGQDVLTLNLRKTPDILAHVAQHANRPALVVGFAAETENMLENARAKLVKKGCDWVLANDVSANQVFGQDTNAVHFIAYNLHEDWGTLLKMQVAQRLVDKIAAHFHSV